MIHCICGKKIIVLQCFDLISILPRDMVIFSKLPRPHGKIFYVLPKGVNTAGPFQDILCYPKREAQCAAPFRIIFKNFSFCISSWTRLASNKKRMTGYIKKPLTAMFIVQTGCGKKHLVLDLIENQYNNHLDYFDCMNE